MFNHKVGNPWRGISGAAGEPPQTSGDRELDGSALREHILQRYPTMLRHNMLYVCISRFSFAIIRLSPLDLLREERGRAGGAELRDRGAEERRGQPQRRRHDRLQHRRVRRHRQERLDPRLRHLEPGTYVHNVYYKYYSLAKLG